ncbi:acyltransferase family protein [Desertivirga arenae]|uniref:acyltransferase family protein n=1 Tax=Desertivirga arenae TaxID=2810309 RepID=UPI001A95C5AE|nr:acyltransferase [Pedobacter sp. SYSU D00823]
MKTSLRVESIQLLRAVAVILVAYVHIVDSSTFASPQQKNLFYLENWGAIGLDLFFVISGFIMTVITPNYVNTGNWKDFLLKRALRIIPIYWLLSIFSYVVSTARGSSFSFEKIIKTVLFLPVFDTSEFVFPIIPVGWSLSLEMYFYLMIAGLLIYANKNIYRNLLILLACLPVLGLFLKPEAAVFKFLFSPLLLEFGMGIISGLIFRRLTSTVNSGNRLQMQALATTLTVLGMGLMITTLFTGFSNVADATVVSENINKALLRALIWGIPSALFLTGVVLLENLFHLSSPKLFVSLGDASYSCYLLHTTILIPISMKIFKLSGVGNGDLYIFFSLLFVLGGSLFFYEFGEKRLNNFIYNNYLAKRNTSKVKKDRKPKLLVNRMAFRLRRPSKTTDSPLV